MTVALKAIAQDAVNMGDCAYEFFEYLTSVLQGMEAIAQTAETSDRTKLILLEKSIKTALYLAQDGAGLVDSSAEDLKEKLSHTSLTSER